jgi:hypothetical protein
MGRPYKPLPKYLGGLAVLGRIGKNLIRVQCRCGRKYECTMYMIWNGYKPKSCRYCAYAAVRKPMAERIEECPSTRRAAFRESFRAAIRKKHQESA